MFRDYTTIKSRTDMRLFLDYKNNVLNLHYLKNLKIAYTKPLNNDWYSILLNEEFRVDIS